jgi:hypothetical protein
MKKKEVKIDGITYTVSASTERGVKDAERMLKRSLKQIKKTKDEDGQTEEEGQPEPI